jgi:hypothetical protein
MPYSVCTSDSAMNAPIRTADRADCITIRKAPMPSTPAAASRAASASAPPSSTNATSV